MTKVFSEVSLFGPNQKSNASREVWLLVLPFFSQLHSSQSLLGLEVSRLGQSQPSPWFGIRTISVSGSCTAPFFSGSLFCKRQLLRQPRAPVNLCLLLSSPKVTTQPELRLPVRQQAGSRVTVGSA